MAGRSYSDLESGEAVAAGGATRHVDGQLQGRANFEETRKAIPKESTRSSLGLPGQAVTHARSRPASGAILWLVRSAGCARRYLQVDASPGLPQVWRFRRYPPSEPTFHWRPAAAAARPPG